MNVAFIDLGTNSMRLLVARVDPHGSYSVLTQQKENIRLGEGEFATDELQPEAMDRTVLVARRFAEMAASFGATHTVAVATSATREAVNQKELLDRLRDEAGLEVHVISGREEARLIYLGVVSGARLESGQCALFVDIGGGSTEIIVGDRDQHRYLDTLKLGTIRLANLYFLPGDTSPLAADRYRLIERFVRAQLVRTVQRVREFEIDLALGSSGTFVTLGDIAAREFLGRPLEKNDSFTRQQLRGVIATLAGLPMEQRLRVPGMSANRGDLIVPGGIIVDVLLQELGIDRVTISDRTLRDGLLMEYLSRIEPQGELVQLGFREQSVLRLARRCRVDLEHAQRVREVAVQLFDSAHEAGLHDLGALERELLEHAAVLHDVGTFLSYTNHRLHSYYFIRNAELLGFDDTEIAVIAATAMFHKKTYPRKRHAEFAALDKRSQRIVRILCVFLRLAESLNRSHSGVVCEARIVRLDDDTAELVLGARGDCELELWSVEGHAKAFRRSFGPCMAVRVAPQPREDIPADPDRVRLDTAL